MGVRLYTALRNVVNQTIDVEGLQETAIETASGVLCAGETLLIVSDGVTKNLRMKIDPESGVICEASGCEDMERILRKKQDIVGAVYEMVWRRTAMFHERIIIKGDNALSGADDDVALVSLTTR
jgi:hypothetical protein